MPKVKFDFETPYRNYPRHEGKRMGMERLEREITTEDMYARFCKAVENYGNLQRARGSSTQFTLLWSTFCNGRWEDYENTQSLAPSGPSAGGNRSLAERVARGEL